MLREELWVRRVRLEGSSSAPVPASITLAAGMAVRSLGSWLSRASAALWAALAADPLDGEGGGAGWVAAGTAAANTAAAANIAPTMRRFMIFLRGTSWVTRMANAHLPWSKGSDGRPFSTAAPTRSGTRTVPGSHSPPTEQFIPSRFFFGEHRQQEPARRPRYGLERADPEWREQAVGGQARHQDRGLGRPR